jgi:hypothetical protein
MLNSECTVLSHFSPHLIYSHVYPLGLKEHGRQSINYWLVLRLKIIAPAVKITDTVIHRQPMLEKPLYNM